MTFILKTYHSHTHFLGTYRVWVGRVELVQAHVRVASRGQKPLVRGYAERVHLLRAFFSVHKKKAGSRVTESGCCSVR